MSPVREVRVGPKDDVEGLRLALNETIRRLNQLIRLVNELERRLDQNEQSSN
jgi:hypothetical protein